MTKFPVGFTDSQLDHCYACVVNSRGLLHCCYAVEAIGGWDCHHGVTTRVSGDAHAAAECCGAFHIVEPAY